MDYNCAMVSGTLQESVREKITASGERAIAFILKSERENGNADIIDCVAKGEIADKITAEFSPMKRITVVGRVQTRAVNLSSGTQKRTEISVETIISTETFEGKCKNNGTD